MSDSLSVSKPRNTATRVLAPFSGKRGAAYDPERPATWGNKAESFYCHHYRELGEHYHKTYEQLEACSQ